MLPGPAIAGSLALPPPGDRRSNGGSAIATPYQVLVTLDSNNFDFTKAKSDLSDLRVTASDGTTLLPFWLEQPYSSLPAFVWVKLPSVPAGDTTIYLYFGNLSAATTSDGKATFDLFDDNWCQFSGSIVLAILYWIKEPQAHGMALM